MIDQRERQFAPAILGKAVEHPLTRQGFAFRLEVARRDCRPGRDIVKSVASGARVGRREQHLDRRHFAGEAGKVVAELW